MNQTRTFDTGTGTINGPFSVTTNDEGTMTLTLSTLKTMPIDQHAFDRILRYAKETTMNQTPCAACLQGEGFFYDGNGRYLCDDCWKRKHPEYYPSDPPTTPEPQTIADVSWDDGDAPMVRAPKGTGYAYCTQAEYDRLTTPEPHEDDTRRPRWLARLNTASVAALFLALTITPAHAAPTTLPAGCTITHEWEDQSKLADCAGTQWAYDPDGLGPYCEKTSKRFGDSGWHTVKATKQAQKDCTREIQQARNR